MKKNDVLPIDVLELEDNEMFVLKGGIGPDGILRSGQGCGCGCGCSGGAGCGCGCASGLGCGCDSGHGCGCGDNPIN